jgi:hypothetical protein
VQGPLRNLSREIPGNADGAEHFELLEAAVLGAPTRKGRDLARGVDRRFSCLVERLAQSNLAGGVNQMGHLG